MSITSNSRSRWTAALALGALLGTALVLPQYADAAAPKDQKVSSQIGKPLQAAQAALQAKDNATAIAKLQEADAYAKKSPYDQHVIDEFYGFAYAGQKDWAQAAKHFEATLNDGFLKDTDVPSRLQIVTQCYYNAAIGARNTDKAAGNALFDKAIQYGNRAIDGGAKADVYSMVMNAAYIKEDYKTSREVSEKEIASLAKEGQTPSTDVLDILRSSCVKLNDNDCLFSSFKTTLTYHPTPDYWDQAVSVIAQGASRNTTSELQLYRLMLDAGVLKRSSDYARMAELALSQGSPGEAKSVLEKGFAENVFTSQIKDEEQKALASAKTKAANDQAALGDLAKEVAASPSGQKAFALGYAYFGYQQYDKAAEMLSKALAAGGLKNEPDARLLLGVAQLKGGHKDDALKTFQQVKGNTALEQIAQLWPLTLNKSGT